MRGVLLAIVSSLSVLSAQAESPFDVAVECIKRYEGLHSSKHHPYVGYGHKLLSGEPFFANMSEQSADSLLRADLLRRCKTFRAFGKDSLLLATLAYNIGESRVLKSRLVQKLKAGYRNIYHDYITFRLINGKVSSQLEKRRKEEFNLLYNE